MQIARMKPPNRKVLNRVILVKAGHARADGKMAASRERRVSIGRGVPASDSYPRAPCPLPIAALSKAMCGPREQRNNSY